MGVEAYKICKMGVFEVYKDALCIEKTGLYGCCVAICVATHFYDIKMIGVDNYE